MKYNIKIDNKYLVATTWTNLEITNYHIQDKLPKIPFCHNLKFARFLLIKFNFSIKNHVYTVIHT